MGNTFDLVVMLSSQGSLRQTTSDQYHSMPLALNVMAKLKGTYHSHTGSVNLLSA